MEKMTVRANPACVYCLGSGVAANIFGPKESICPCVTEQLRIITVDKNYCIQECHHPGHPEFVKE